MAEEGREPAVPANIDNAQALFKQTTGNGSILVRLYVLGDSASAEKQWAAFAEALRNPPPDVLGGSAKMVDVASPQVGQLQKSYVTEKPDASGNLVWTDIYRQGKVVLLTQVLSSSSSDGMALRKTVAERALAQAK